MPNLIKKILVVSLACAVPFTAHAEGRSEIIINEQGVRTMIVTYDDLNLSTVAGQKALSNRIRVAVHKVCGGTTARQSLGEMQDYQTCTNRASQNALVSLDKATKARLAVNF